MDKKTLIVAVILISGFMAYIFFNKNTMDSTQQQEYQRESLTIKGSDTEVQMVSNLSEAFLEKYPGIDISVTGGGSGVGIAALLNKEINLANSSRPMKKEEFDLAKERGIEVQEYILATDSLSIIVNPQNGMNSINIDDLGRIYKGEISNWKDIGGKDGKIVLYGRQSTSGTYVFFRDYVLKGDYAPQMKSMEGNQAIVDAVKTDVNGIGYTGVGYVKDGNGNLRSDIKILSVASEAGVSAVSSLDEEAVKNGRYPITRPIYQYLSHIPEKDSLMAEFLRFASSVEGGEIKKKSGFYPVSEDGLGQNQLLFEKMQ